MTTDYERIYCTWSYRESLPNWLQVSFGDLDDFLRRLISDAQRSLIIVTPYLSIPGLQLVSGALSACAERPISVRIITQLSGGPAEANKLAVKSLMDHLRGSPLYHRVRILSSTEKLFIHAKLVLADSRRGYIGSANLSARGLERNLEIGVALSLPQAHAATQLIDCLESQRALVEYRNVV